MAIFLRDSFTDTDNTGLASHTPEIGDWTFWNVAGSVEAPADIVSNRLKNTGSASDSDNSFWRGSDAPASADYEVFSRLYVASSTRNTGLLIRCVSSEKTGYLAYVGASSIMLYRMSTGAFSKLVTYNVSLTQGNNYELKIKASGTGATVTVTVSLDGTDVITYNDTNTYRIVSAGYPGVLLDGGSGYEFDYIEAGGIDETGVADDTAPNLTSATGTATGETTASGSVTTDEATGTLYVVATTSSTKPSKPQVAAGQDNTGSAAAWSGSQAVSSAGSKSVMATGLSASTSYYFHYMHEDAAENQSDVVSSESFTTSAPDTTAPTLTSPTATATDRTTATGTVSTNEASGTLYWLATESVTESVSNVKAGSSQGVTATGEQSVSVTGLTAATSYYLHYVHTDASNNDSDVATSAQFTTQSLPSLTKLFILGDSTSAAYAGQNAVSSYLNADFTIVDLAVPGDAINNQKDDWNAYDADTKLAAAYVIIQLGLNDLAPAEAASVAIARLQALVDDVASDTQSGCRIIVAQMTPCRARLIALYGATNGPIAYQKWLDMNEAIAGGGATPITGVDGRVTYHVALLNDGSGNLAAAYDIGDGIHENNAGRVIVAQAWNSEITALETGVRITWGVPVSFDGAFSDVTLAQLGNAAVILRVWRVS